MGSWGPSGASAGSSGPSARRRGATLQIVQPLRDCASKLPGAGAPRRHEKPVGLNWALSPGLMRTGGRMHVSHDEASTSVSFLLLSRIIGSGELAALQNWTDSHTICGNLRLQRSGEYHFCFMLDHADPLGRIRIKPREPPRDPRSLLAMRFCGCDSRADRAAFHGGGTRNGVGIGYDISTAPRLGSAVSIPCTDPRYGRRSRGR